MNSKRVFAHEETNYFSDYIKNKIGIEILKNMKSKHKDPVFFLSYDRFILLTKTYFRYLTKNKIDISVPVNIYNTNTSFICYKSLLSHMSDCSYCRNCNDILNICECKEIKGILYPYGLYISENSPNGIYLHNRFTLDDWCIKCQAEVIKDADEYEDEDEKNNEYDNGLSSNCKCCSNKKSIANKEKAKKNIYVFPSQNKFVFENKRKKYDNDYENRQKMNAYAIYPNIHNCENKEKEEKEKQEMSCKKTGLCKNLKPLFI